MRWQSLAWKIENRPCLKYVAGPWCQQDCQQQGWILDVDACQMRLGGELPNFQTCSSSLYYIL